MNLDNVKALAKIINDYKLTALEVSEGETTIRLEQGALAPVAGVPVTAPVAPQPIVPAAASIETTTPTTSDEQTVDFSHLTEVKSPLVGVFYSAPSPDAEPFVTLGRRVKKGDVMCIIETMKLMNEIIAEQDGEVVDICVKNGDIVEFGQVIFKVH